MAYYVSTFSGLGQVAEQEMVDKVGDAAFNFTTHRAPDLDLLRFDFSGSVNKLAHIGTAEDIYYFLADIPLKGTADDLGKLKQAITDSPDFQLALAAHKQLRQPKRKATVRYRVVAQAEDANWRQYRRVDMQRAVERTLSDQYRKWKLVPDDADLEFWIQQAGKRALIGLRLTDRTQRHRTYKQANLPGSLRPTIAYALAYLTKPEPDDVFLDPMCGAGTVLIERARAGRYRQLFGGDISSEAVEATLANLGKQHKPWEVKVWDARKLPLDDGCVDKIAVNLPWGRQIGSETDNEALYRDCIQEASRVLRPRGSVVVLTSQWELLKKALAESDLATEKHFANVSVLGWHADIFVLTR